MSMQEFADRAGLTRGYISRLEMNKNSHSGAAVVPSIRTFDKCARAMEITVDELINMCDGDQQIALVSTPKEERLYQHYQAIAQLLGLDVNDVARAISFIMEVKKE